MAEPLALSALYGLMVLPQLRYVAKVHDQHVGNMTVKRIAGMGLSRIALENFGIALPMLSLSVQYDIFGSDMRRYKLAHALLTGLHAPLLYALLRLLGFAGGEALAGAALYAVFYHAPATLNMLVQPEHYEVLAFLAGACLALAGGTAAASAGMVLLGCAHLCKFPSFISLWFLAAALAGALPAPLPLAPAAALGLHLLPLAAHLAAVCWRGRLRGEAPETADNFSRIVQNYLWKFRWLAANWRSYAMGEIVRPLAGYLLQAAPLLVLAAAGLVGMDSGRRLLFLSGLVAVSLVFAARLCGYYTYSLTVLLAASAGTGLAVGHGLPFWALLAGAAVLSVQAVRRDPNAYWLFSPRPRPGTGDMARLGRYVSDNSTAGTPFLINIADSVGSLHTLAGRALYPNVPILAFWDRGWMCKALPRLAQGVGECPPAFIAHHLLTAPVLDLDRFEAAAGLRYEPAAKFGFFLLHRLAGRREPTGAWDESLLSPAGMARIEADAARLGEGA